MSPTFHTHHTPGRTASTDGGEFLFFSGTAYLGMPLQKEFHECVVEGMSRYGSNYGSSRTSNLRLRVFEEAEKWLAEFTGSAAALTMSSGYLAGQLLAQWLSKYLDRQTTRVFYAPHTHPAVWLPEMPALSDLTFEQWTAEVVENINTDVNSTDFVIVANSVNSLHGQIHRFEWLRQIRSTCKIWLVVDDSHGLGITGTKGNGVFSRLPDLPFVEKMVVASMGKALGIPAGVVLGSAQVIEKMRDTGFYSGGSPAPPAMLYAFLKYKDRYALHRLALLENIRLFRAQLANCPALFQYSEDYPVFYTPQQSLYPFLIERGILLSCFAYPKASGNMITRVVINALHTGEDIEKLSSAIQGFC